MRGVELKDTLGIKNQSAQVLLKIWTRERQRERGYSMNYYSKGTTRPSRKVKRLKIALTSTVIHLLMTAVCQAIPEILMTRAALGALSTLMEVQTQILEAIGKS
jgi:hypothetical protein